MQAIVRQRPATRLEIIGHSFDVVVSRELHRLVAELGLTQQVRLTGFIRHGELMRRMAQASVLASASTAEVANLVVLEAMTVGTPVVLADTPAQREMAGAAGLFVGENANSAKAYADAILDLLEHPDRRDALAQAGRRRARQFDWAHTASAILAALRVATESRKVAAGTADAIVVRAGEPAVEGPPAV
jgi:glycosyltransferase involved in cell wall biosynthesis